MAKRGYYGFQLGESEALIRQICEWLGIDPDSRGAYARAIRFALRLAVYERKDKEEQT
jgi:hypothetical protein